MEFHIPTTEEIVAKYSDYNPALDTESALEAKRDELQPLVKDDLEILAIAKTGENCEKNDVNCDGVVDLKDVTWQEWIAMILFFGFIFVVIRWIVRKIKK